VARHPQSVSLLRLLERAEQVARNLELEFPSPTWKSVSEKLWRLVALLRSPQNGLIHSAVVLVSSAPSALVITKFLERVSSLGHNVGMQGARVSSLISSNGSVAQQTTVDGFKNGLSNILVTSDTTRGLPLNRCQVVQFDVAKLWDVADLTHYYMVVRISHPLADYLGGLFLKAIA
jgi:superfamily II DNA/RNA helicase